MLKGNTHSYVVRYANNLQCPMQFSCSRGLASYWFESLKGVLHDFLLVRSKLLPIRSSIFGLLYNNSLRHREAVLVICSRRFFPLTLTDWTHIRITLPATIPIRYMFYKLILYDTWRFRQMVVNKIKYIFIMVYIVNILCIGVTLYINSIVLIYHY